MATVEGRRVVDGSCFGFSMVVKDPIQKRYRIEIWQRLSRVGLRVEASMRKVSSLTLVFLIKESGDCV